MNTISEKRIYLGKVALAFLILCLPSVAFRWWNPDPLTTVRAERYRWLAALLSDPPELRMAMVGSSQIAFALDASRISHRIYGSQDRALNAGSPHSGRGRDWLLAQKLLEIPTIEVLVVEVGYAEEESVHKYFHRLARLPEALRDPYLRPATAWHLDKARLRARFAVESTLCNATSGYAQLLYRGYVRARFRDPLGSELSDSWGTWRTRKVLTEPLLPRPRPEYVPDISARGTQYLDRIARLCKVKGVELVFVDIPRFGEPAIGARYEAFLQDLGGTVIPFTLGDDFFQPAYWSDRYHPNVEGAQIFTDHFVEHLRMMLLPEDVGSITHD